MIKYTVDFFYKKKKAKKGGYFWSRHTFKGTTNVELGKQKKLLNMQTYGQSG